MHHICKSCRNKCLVLVLAEMQSVRGTTLPGTGFYAAALFISASDRRLQVRTAGESWQIAEFGVGMMGFLVLAWLLGLWVSVCMYDFEGGEWSGVILGGLMDCFGGWLH